MLPRGLSAPGGCLVPGGGSLGGCLFQGGSAPGDLLGGAWLQGGAWSQGGVPACTEADPHPL